MAKHYKYAGTCEIDNGLTSVVLEATCSMCKKTKRIIVDPTGYHKWLNGTLIQNALPDVPSQDRELLISGICGSCFDNLDPYLEV